MKKGIVYDYNVAVLKRYGNKYRLSVHTALRRPGVEIDKPIKVKIDKRKNKIKLDESISRARSKVKEYLLCNDWTWFVSLTISPQKFDRYNLKAYYSNFSRWLYNMNKRRIRAGKDKIKYLFIPEMHKNGAWHMHGVIQGINEDELRKLDYEYFTSGVPDKIRKKLDEGDTLYSWEDYKNNYGFCVFSRIKCKDKVTSYINKYLTKDICKGVTDLNANLYYCSKGLNTATEIIRGHITNYVYAPHYSNDYVKVLWLEDEEQFKKVKESITKVEFNRLYMDLQDKEWVKMLKKHSEERFEEYKKFVYETWGEILKGTFK